MEINVNVKKAGLEIPVKHIVKTRVENQWSIQMEELLVSVTLVIMDTGAPRSVHRENSLMTNFRNVVQFHRVPKIASENGIIVPLILQIIINVCRNTLLFLPWRMEVLPVLIIIIK